MIRRHSLTLEIAAFLVWNPAPPRPTVLGVVVEANGVHLNAGAVSPGATVYDGDRFSTEARGILCLRGDASTTELAGESIVIVRSRTDGAQGTETELSQGTLVFRTTRVSALEIVAREARVRPLTDARTIAQVSVTGPKELCIYARRGALQFWYRGESVTIAEGESYRVMLDPQEDASQKKQTRQKAGKPPKAFLFLAIGGATAGATAAVILQENHGHKKMESPDRP